MIYRLFIQITKTFLKTNPKPPDGLLVQKNQSREQFQLY